MGSGTSDEALMLVGQMVLNEFQGGERATTDPLRRCTGTASRVRTSGGLVGHACPTRSAAASMARIVLSFLCRSTVGSLRITTRGNNLEVTANAVPVSH
jgi:hypothetical protein